MYLERQRKRQIMICNKQFLISITLKVEGGTDAINISLFFLVCSMLRVVVIDVILWTIRFHSSRFCAILRSAFRDDPINSLILWETIIFSLFKFWETSLFKFSTYSGKMAKLGKNSFPAWSGVFQKLPFILIF